MSFHDGEISVQTQAGVRAEAQRLCSVIHPLVKPAAEEFLRTQSLGIASSVDAQGQVWASLLTGSPGFVRPFSPQIVQISSTLIPGDPLCRNLCCSNQLGLLVIDLSTRRRLRLNGRARIETGEIQVEVQQVYFNCPKYIQIRHLQTTETAFQPPSQVEELTALSPPQQDWITQADTFFVASSQPENGADASHRGGMPGFVQVLSPNKLVFPDYAGNNLFQTLGNLAENPSAGLLFIDFIQGHTLQLTGKAEIVWDSSRLSDFAGAQRLVEFQIDQVRCTANATPLRWQFGEYSPANPAFDQAS